MTSRETDQALYEQGYRWRVRAYYRSAEPPNTQALAFQTIHRTEESAYRDVEEALSRDDIQMSVKTQIFGMRVVDNG
jgi:hypothetical protein